MIMAFVLRKVIDLEFYFWRHLFSPLLVGCVSLVVMSVFHAGLGGFLNYFVSMIISALVGIIVYMCWIYFSDFFTIKEKKNFKLKKARLSTSKKSKNRT